MGICWGVFVVFERSGLDMARARVAPVHRRVAGHFPVANDAAFACHHAAARARPGAVYDAGQ